jgi:hypothetical protein
MDLINTLTGEDPHAQSTEILKIIKFKIEMMNKYQHIEILKILKKYTQQKMEGITRRHSRNPAPKPQYKPVKLNENKNGVYVNISFLSPPIIKELISYIDYIDVQNKTLAETNDI